MAGIVHCILIHQLILIGYGPHADNPCSVTHCSTEYWGASFDDPEQPKIGAFSRSYLNPPELQYGCFGTSDERENRYADQLGKGKPDEQLAAARALWQGRSRRQAASVIKFLAGSLPAGHEFGALKRDVDAALKPESILRELREGDYLWGTWLAFLRPHKDLVPVLLAGLKEKPDQLDETILALGKSGDPRALDPLIEFLRSNKETTAGYAAKALGYMNDPKVEPLLIKALGSSGGWQTVQVCDALAEIGTLKSLPELQKLADCREYTGAMNVRGMAKEAVSRIELRHMPHDPARWPPGPEKKPVAELKGHENYVWSMAFNPDGQVLASVGDGYAVRLWDPTKAKVVANYSGHVEQMTHVAFAGQGLLAVCGWGQDCDIHLLSVKNGNVIDKLKVEDGGVRSLVATPDGKWIVFSSRGDKHAMRFWDVAARKEIAAVPGWFRILAISPDGKRLAATSEDSDEDILLWDVATRKLVTTLKGHKDEVESASFSADGRLLASGAGRIVKVWEVQTEKAIASLRGDFAIRAVSMSPDGRSVAASESDGIVRVWDIATEKTTARLKASGPVVFSPDRKRLATVSKDDNIILLWNTP
jgi:Tol biopolymer transport system component